MRRIVSVTALTLAISACTAPQQPVAQSAPPPPPVVQAPQPVENGPVIGMSAAQLVSAFGNPALQVREGRSLKLQFRAAACVLDAYLYPTASGERVTHVDARLPSGADADAQACVGQLARRS